MENANELRSYFANNTGRLIHKWDHYFDVYETHFARYRNKDIVILEIGVSHGGSLQLWRKYFGAKAKIYGIDIDPRCKALEEQNIEILIGSQSDRKFLRDVTQKIPKVDILIDDGGHTMIQQITSFQELYAHIKDDGVYLCEDLHTSYWLNVGGGVRRKGSFIEFSKNLIDQLNAYHSHQQKLQVSDFTKTTSSIHYYDSVIVIEKKLRNPPYDSKTGSPSFEDKIEPLTMQKKIYMLSLNTVNRILRYLRLPGLYRH